VNDGEEDEVVTAARGVDTQLMTIRPRLGTGWETTVNNMTKEVWLRFKILGLALPVKKRIPFSKVVHVAVVCRESWWSRAGDPWGFWQNFVMFGIGSLNARTPMPTKGWRYDLLMTQKGGQTIKIDTVKSPHTADDLVGQLRLRLGLPSAN
jgi:hypothetical protein